MTFDADDAEYLSPSQLDEPLPPQSGLPPPSRQVSTQAPSTPPMSDAEKQAYVDMVNDPYRFVRGPKPRREDKVIRQKLPLRDADEEAASSVEDDDETKAKDEGSPVKDSRPPASSAWSSTVSRTLDTLGNKSHMPASKMDDQAKRAFVDMVNDPNRFVRGRNNQDPGAGDEGTTKEKRDIDEVINFRPVDDEEEGVGTGVEGRSAEQPPVIAPITPSDSFVPPLPTTEPPIDMSKMDLSQRLEVAAIAEEGRLQEIKRIRAEQEKIAKIKNLELRKKEAERISELNRLREAEIRKEEERRKFERSRKEEEKMRLLEQKERLLKEAEAKQMGYWEKKLKEEEDARARSAGGGGEGVEGGEGEGERVREEGGLLKSDPMAFFARKQSEGSGLGRVGAAESATPPVAAAAAAGPTVEELMEQQRLKEERLNEIAQARAAEEAARLETEAKERAEYEAFEKRAKQEAEESMRKMEEARRREEERERMEMERKRQERENAIKEKEEEERRRMETAKEEERVKMEAAFEKIRLAEEEAERIRKEIAARNEAEEEGNGGKKERIDLRKLTLKKEEGKEEGKGEEEGGKGGAGFRSKVTEEEKAKARRFGIKLDGL
ncbi:hypothetical protein TrCOL_g5002 [Triparma columacea]|uniref:Uncharacterized protein n=1 Tax=Triparma columacea TaxID=722753 RepID=A0A9W7L1R2_9STRA|nr:hypothetical protein TrCOL_g5002 [Triparma columacea]